MKTVKRKWYNIYNSSPPTPDTIHLIDFQEIASTKRDTKRMSWSKERTTTMCHKRIMWNENEEKKVNFKSIMVIITNKTCIVSLGDEPISHIIDGCASECVWEWTHTCTKRSNNNHRCRLPLCRSQSLAQRTYVYNYYQFWSRSKYPIQQIISDIYWTNFELIFLRHQLQLLHKHTLTHSLARISLFPVYCCYTFNGLSFVININICEIGYDKNPFR